MPLVAVGAARNSVFVSQVYVDGVLYAALLEDVVMQPMTGKLMAVLYRFYTPGQHMIAP
jgi:hypothetical protein